MYSRRAGRVGRRKEYEHATVMRIKGSCNERGERIRVGVGVGVGALEQRPYKDVWTFLAFPESRVAHLGTGAKRVNGSRSAYFFEYHELRVLWAENGAERTVAIEQSIKPANQRVSNLSICAGDLSCHATTLRFTNR